MLSHEKLQAIAFQTGFPMSFFKQEVGPDFPLGSLLFRARASMTKLEKSEAHQYGKLIFESVEKMERHLTRIPLKLPRLTEDVFTAAKITRSELGLPPDAPIRNLIRTLEKNGVLILAIPTALKRRDAFSVWAGGDLLRPVIVIAGESPGDRLRYSVAHELGHLVIHQAIRGGLSEIEREADQFAAEFLMPGEGIKRDLNSPVTLTSLAALKPRWGVSIQALIRRALELKVITYRQYKYLMQQLSFRGWRTREPANLDVPVEKPRAVRKMAEVLYGIPINYKRLAGDLRLPIRRAKEIIEAHAANAHVTIDPNMKDTFSSGRLLDFTRKT
jgi:Zn-dependent peptidase ImmA (M78 family)